MSLSGSMDSTGFRAKARGLAAAVNHGLKAVVNTLRYCRLFDSGQLHRGSINWKLYFQPDIFKLFDNKQLHWGSMNWKRYFQPDIFKLFDNNQLHWGSMNWKPYFQPGIFKLFDNRQMYRFTINWKFWFLCSLVRIEIYSDSMSSGKGSDLTTAFKPWLISMRC